MKNVKKDKKSDKDAPDFKQMSMPPVQTTGNCYDCEGCDYTCDDNCDGCDDN